MDGHFYEAAAALYRANGAGGVYKDSYGEKSDSYVKLAKRFLYQLPVNGAYTGKFVREYLAEQIVERGKESLLNSNYSITEIAYSFGFSDTQNFMRTFKKISGITPTEFRNQFLVVYEEEV